jgi:glycine/D-amino acid oxidase-like deaminating enzyme
VRRLGRDAVAHTADGPAVRAEAAVLAVNSATPSFAGYRLAVGVASSHMIVTEPVPDVIEELGWNGESIADCRTLLHYMRPTRDGRIALGWGGGRMGFGGRHDTWLDLDRSAVESARDALVALFPGLRGRAITHAWGGPIDVSPTHLPIFGSRGRVHHGFGFTGNGVGPTYLGGEILARLALDRRDALTGLALVDPDRKLMPSEPFRWAGGTAIRAALVRRDAANDRGSEPDALTGLVASLPRRLGLHLPR